MSTSDSMCAEAHIIMVKYCELPIEPPGIWVSVSVSILARRFTEFLHMVAEVAICWK